MSKFEIPYTCQGVPNKLIREITVALNKVNYFNKIKLH